MKSCLFVLTLLASFAMIPGPVQADMIYNVSINTSPLIGNAAGPFSLDFQFTDGSGAGDGNNTVTLSNFAFGTGAASGSATTTGSVSGNLTSGLALTDSQFFNEFTQAFTPGSVLTFKVDLTTNVDSGGVPDEFTFAILDSTGAEIPTVGPSDTFLLADINSSTPSLYGYASDTSRGTAATGQPINLAAPVITAPVASPEPSTRWLPVCGFAVLVLRRRFTGLLS